MTACPCWRCFCSASTAISTGAPIEVEFIDFVRDDRKFASSEELVAQMQVDCARAAEMLAAAPAAPDATS